jgi:hypothetical protein
VDYLVKIKNQKQVFLIELKTDIHSRRTKQDEYLKKAEKAGMEKLLEDLGTIYKATKAKKKYHCLLLELESAGLIHVSNNKLFNITEHAKNNKVSIIYIQPNKTCDHCDIYFEELADFIGRKEDELSQRFALSLKRWAIEPAGLL